MGNQGRLRKVAVLLCISLICSLALPTGAFAAEKSQAPGAGDITVENNVKKNDTVYICGLAPGDTVTIYNGQVKKLSSKKVPANKTDVSFSFSQLGVGEGFISVSVTSPKMTESDQTKVKFAAEDISYDIDPLQVTVTNKAGASATARIEGVEPKDIIKVYNAASGGRLLKSGTVPASKEEITLSVGQLAAAGGSIFVSVTSSGKREGNRVEVKFGEQEQTEALSPYDITITNNPTGTKDTIRVSGIQKGDVIAVYDSAEKGKTLAKNTCNGTQGEMTISITQLGKESGTVYISLKASGLLESERVPVIYEAEGQSQAINDEKDIIITNNPAGKSDTVVVNNLDEGDTIQVYKEETKTALWGKATVASGKDSVTISVTQLGVASGSAWITNTKKGMNESARVKIDYDAEGESEGIDKDNVTVVNNANAADVIYVKGVSQKDKVNVYRNSDRRVLLGSATAQTYDTSVTITIAQLGAGNGTVYLSLVQDGKRESALTSVDYDAEAVSKSLSESASASASAITITNNAGIADIIAVAGLKAGDTIKVYRDVNCNELIGKGTSASGGTLSISISQLGTDTGTVYITVTSTNKAESLATTAGYAAEAKTDAITGEYVRVINRTGSASTLTAMGLEGSTTVKVYDKLTGGNLLGSGSAGTYGGDITVSLASLSNDAGNVYVSLQTTGKMESDRVGIGYTGKKVTAAPAEGDIEVVNNVGLADTVTVINLSAGDIVKVYEKKDTYSELLGSGTAPSGSTEVVISVSQLGKTGGAVYVSVTSNGKLESELTEAKFIGESDSNAPLEEFISVLNYADADDEITVRDISSGDVVKVYRNLTGGAVIGTATAGQSATSVKVYVAQLGVSEGKIYVSVKSVGKNESKRTEVSYAGESKAPAESSVVVENNVSMSDIITVSNLTANDIVKVYDAAKGGQLLGFAYASGNTGSVTISVAQLSEAAGSVYVSVTNSGKCESARTKANYLAEQSGTQPYAGHITIGNNPNGTNDTITVSHLTENDLVKVYSSAQGGSLLGSATAQASGTVTISVKQLGTSAGSVYISVTSVGKKESARVKADYTAED